ncbi:IS1380 family transposase [Tsukamurella sp. M9C]|uniref:IS1380 family transposase n=1 Tax=Tsukamurella sp. M9C TaxID=2877520 RepID=UPI001CC9B85F|nr:IS1380 family transposase [Tsukamurella sp. M9C]MCA0154757.1 IS1380 family transposase [Tsukamurella sp. M9C]
MNQSTSLYPALAVDAAGQHLVSHAGTVLLLRAAETAGLAAALSSSLMPWRKPNAVHDPGKIIVDLAVSIAAGGDCLADLDQLRSQTAVMGQVASDPTVSRLITALAANADRALAAIGSATAQTRARVCALAGEDAPDHQVTAEIPLVIDLDATLITAHSEKLDAAPNFKKGFGFHPLMGFVDHGPAGTGEPVAVLLRPGNAGSNTAADHISVVKQALAQLPDTVTSVGRYRVGRKVLIRADGGGGTHQFLDYLTLRHLSYSIGFGLTDKLAAAVDLVPESAWIAAIDDDTGRVRDGAWVTELTDLVDLSSWPAGIRLIIRAERPHPGAQLTFTDRDGMRLTQRSSPTAAARSKRLELRHRRRARCEDRIRALKDTGLRNLPLHRFDQNRIWAAIAALASTLITWTQTLALTSHDARRWEPKKLRHRLLRPPNPTAPGRDRPPDTDVLLVGLSRLDRLRAPT